MHPVVTAITAACALTAVVVAAYVLRADARDARMERRRARELALWRAGEQP